MEYIIHVTEYNKQKTAEENYTMVFTSGNGSMIDKPRVKGWVIYNKNGAKWFPNKLDAELELRIKEVK